MEEIGKDCVRNVSRTFWENIQCVLATKLCFNRSRLPLRNEMPHRGRSSLTVRSWPADSKYYYDYYDIFLLSSSFIIP